MSDIELSERLLVQLIDATTWELKELRRKRAEAVRPNAGSNVVQFPRRQPEFAEAG